MENQLTIEAKYTLYLLDTSLEHINDLKFDENKAIGSNVATIFCSDKTCIIPPLSEASFTVKLLKNVMNINVYLCIFFLDWDYSLKFWKYKYLHKT